MSRFALFVDAGYLLAWGAGHIVGARAPRAAVSCNYGQVVNSLIAQCHAKAPNEEILRVYWYDGARDQVPTAEHITIGLLANVKVRLGRLSRGEQKGVDTLIVLDLTTLARESGITSAFLLSGDEDLREGVLVAQQLGVRVVLLGLAAAGGAANQAPTLMREADLLVDMTAVVDPCFSHVATAAYTAGVAFGQNLVVATPGAVVGLSAQKAGHNLMIPQPQDLQLQNYVKGALAPQPLLQPLAKLDQWQIREARRGFWDQIP